jgi:TPP-dependent trihydroxycyclohexane-1,2-dione (THcHDO) dehydratase
MLAALSWNEMQQTATSAKSSVTWSKGKAAWTIKSKTKKSNATPKHVKGLIKRAVEVTEKKIMLPAITIPKDLKRLGSHVPKPSLSQLQSALRK